MGKRQVEMRHSRRIGDETKPYIIAEVNTSHFGNIEIAKDMALKAKEAGCECVKFQSWTATSINSKSVYEKNPLSKRLYDKFSFSNDKLLEIVKYCNEIGISFASTPYSKDEVDFLVEDAKVPFIKIASMELNNLDFLTYIANKGIPMILSTGMGSLEEIEAAVQAIELTGNKQLCIFHCVSIYPPENAIMNLNNIVDFRERFKDYPIGFSDHSIGIDLASATIALGASIIEKHMTLDKTRMGMDNQMAAEPDEMKALVDSCNKVHEALGNKRRTVPEAELEQRKVMRRSFVYSSDFRSGHVISESDIELKRPGTGLQPQEKSIIVGRALTKDVNEDYLVHLDDFKS